MIDIENYVINQLSTAFTGTADVTGVFVEEPESFPCVYAHEVSNSTVSWVADESLNEHAAKVTIRLEYYSALVSGAKQQIKEMMEIGDTTMSSMKFTRTSSSIIPNYDRSVVRGYADYTAIVGEPKTVGDDLIYQMYRS